MPALAAVGGPAAFDAEGGSIRAAAAVGALVGRLGDDLVTDEALAMWERAEGSVEVRAAGARGEHGSAVVCAGRDTARFARGLGLSIPIEMSLHGRVSFDVRGPAPARLACLLDGSEQFGEAGVYGAPSPGSSRYSIGVDGRAAAREDASVIAPATLASVTDRGLAYVRRALPGLDPTPVDYRHCWVTSLPWGEDAIGVGSRAGRCSSRATTCSSTRRPWGGGARGGRPRRPARRRAASGRAARGRGRALAA